MKEYEFILKFSLPDTNQDPSDFIDALAEAGCDDATIGIGKKGRLALDFCRESDSAENALRTAIHDVESAIPGAKLIEAAPDLVGVSEIANIFNFTRQNITKYVSKPSSRFPAPIHDGNSQLWHLIDVLRWYENRYSSKIHHIEIIGEIALESRKVNLRKEQDNLSDYEGQLSYH